MTRVLTRADVPPGSKLLWVSDVHVPYHDEHACRMMVECAEDVGVTHVILGGDIFDCGISSPHQRKRAKDRIAWGTLAAASTPGRWLVDWARTRTCYYLLGNHEYWVASHVETDPGLSGVTTEELLGLPRGGPPGSGWEVIPASGRLRLGSYVWEHGHGLLPRGSGAVFPANKIRAKCPEQTTQIGHCHVMGSTRWTFPNERGHPKTHSAYLHGHMSLPEAHTEYAGGYPGWQQGFAFNYVYHAGGHTRVTVDQVEVLRDRAGRPIFEYRGITYG